MAVNRSETTLRSKLLARQRISPSVIRKNPALGPRGSSPFSISLKSYAVHKIYMRSGNCVVTAMLACLLTQILTILIFAGQVTSPSHIHRLDGHPRLIVISDI